MASHLFQHQKTPNSVHMKLQPTETLRGTCWLWQIPQFPVRSKQGRAESFCMEPVHFLWPVLADVRDVDEDIGAFRFSPDRRYNVAMMWFVGLDIDPVWVTVILYNRLRVLETGISVHEPVLVF